LEPTSPRLRVIHYGSGGGKGVTRVITNLALGHAAGRDVDVLPVFRRKRGRTLGPAFRADLGQAGLAWCEVVPRPMYRTVRELRAIIREFRPDAFVAHGYSEHISGRLAALAEGVPVVVHVEHAHERYSLLNLWRMRRLAARSQAVVGVSYGVAERLIELGVPRDSVEVLYNGIRLARYVEPTPPPIDERERAVVMISRFAAVKDPHTLIRAIALLRARGLDVPLRLVGGGRRWPRFTAERLCRRLGVEDLVQFLGHRDDVPDLLRRHRVAALSTRAEGFGLSVAEALAAGCAVVASRVRGVEELIDHGESGWLAAAQDPESMADGIAAALGEDGARWAANGAAGSRERFTLERMTRDYETLLLRLADARTKRTVERLDAATRAA
jgi:glycosyltransferase involved in cell wall biosynthesis